MRLPFGRHPPCMPLGPNGEASRRFPREGNAIPKRSSEPSVWTTPVSPTYTSARLLSMGDLSGLLGASDGAGLLSPPPPDLFDSRQCFVSQKAGSVCVVQGEPPL